MNCEYRLYMAEPPAPLSPAALRLAGHVGQTALDRVAAGGVAIIADLDQHVAAVRAELAAACQERPAISAESAAGAARATCPDVPFAATALHAETTVPVELLLHYASGFVQAALGDGWVPAASADADDWVSLRLAAICQLIRQAEAAATAHPDLHALGTAVTDQGTR
jgi:hypothetical protein